MSRQVDRFRPPYGRRVIEAPRECIFAGTTNKDTYLKDETGGRRFWPVKVGAIKIDELRRDRDQLWAEARYRYRAGDKWWLERGALLADAAEEAGERYENDPWEEKILKWITDRESVSIPEVLESCLEKRRDTWIQMDQNRVARVLKTNKWERYQKRIGPRPNDREWRYRPSPCHQGESKAVTS